MWEKYWNEYGGGLLWQSWQEKHADQTLCPEPWNVPDTKEEWEQHYSQMYWYYLEQFQYWEAQGWTFDASQSQDTDPGGSEIEVDNKKDENHMKADELFLHLYLLAAKALVQVIKITVKFSMELVT